MSDKKARDSFLAKFGTKVEKCEHDGETFYVKKISTAQFESYMFPLAKKGKLNEAGELNVDIEEFSAVRAELLALCLCDEDGNLLFESAADANDAIINEHIEPLYKICMDVNGGSKKSVEDAEKNSPATND